MTDEVKNLVKTMKNLFPKSFVNHNNELIVEPRNNIYFRLEDVENELDFKCKVIAWLSRPSCKGVSVYWQKKIRKLFNDLLGTNFNEEEMSEIYTYLGNDVNRKLCIQFIESNYDLSIIANHKKKKDGIA